MRLYLSFVMTFEIVDFELHSIILLLKVKRKTTIFVFQSVKFILCLEIPIP